MHRPFGINEKRHRDAALQNLEDSKAFASPRQHLGVRQPHAAFKKHHTICPMLLITPIYDCFRGYFAACFSSGNKYFANGQSLSERIPSTTQEALNFAPSGVV